MKTKALALIILIQFTIVTTPALAAENAKHSSNNAPAHTQRAIFAGGCFWCMEPPFDQLEGVISTTSGYIGGHKDNPTYEEVSDGSTGHTEAVEIIYDSSKITYPELLDVFWVNIDPLNEKGQFCDYGSQYRSEIFYLDDEQQRQASLSLDKIKQRFDKPVATKVTAATRFYPAEDYHQNYYQVNPVRYNYYRWACGRDARLEELWGKKSGH
jgi:peptide-methionine (S)-S-oxide reductase